MQKNTDIGWNPGKKLLSTQPHLSPGMLRFDSSPIHFASQGGSSHRISQVGSGISGSSLATTACLGFRAWNNDSRDCSSPPCVCNVLSYAPHPHRVPLGPRAHFYRVDRMPGFRATLSLHIFLNVSVYQYANAAIVAQAWHMSLGSHRNSGNL
jgi:hypothetical protein